MHHRGIFRVPGAQSDIYAYKSQFEQGLQLDDDDDDDDGH